MIQAPDEPHYRMVAQRILAGKVVPFLGPESIYAAGRSPWHGHGASTCRAARS